MNCVYLIIPRDNQKCLSSIFPNWLSIPATRVVTGMVAQEILEACDDVTAAAGGGGGGGEGNLANPALGRFKNVL